MNDYLTIKEVSEVTGLSKRAICKRLSTDLNHSLNYLKVKYIPNTLTILWTGLFREHAAITPMFLGIKAIISKSYARIHKNNLINHGVIPLVFTNKDDYDKLDIEDDKRFCESDKK